MKITIKEKLKELRKKNDITQEQLANHLGISQQSVCKWERGEGYPDITLLPAIALYFGITLDELMGIDEARISNIVNAYISESHALQNVGEIKKNLELWKKVYKEFPQNELVKYQYMCAMWAYWFDNIEENPDMPEEIICIAKNLLDTSNDVGIREGAIQKLCYTYNTLGDKEAAKKYANMAGSYWVAKSELLLGILTGEEAAEQAQWNIYDLIDILALNIRGLRYSTCNRTPEENIHHHQICIDLFKLIYENEDYGFHVCRLTQNYRDIAFEYALLGNADACLDALENVVKYAVICDTQPDYKHTSPLLDRMEFTRTASSKNYTENECALRLKGLQHKAYDFVRDNPRFIKISEELAKYAN